MIHTVLALPEKWFDASEAVQSEKQFLLRIVTAPPASTFAFRIDAGSLRVGGARSMLVNVVFKRALDLGFEYLVGRGTGSDRLQLGATAIVGDANITCGSLHAALVHTARMVADDILGEGVVLASCGSGLLAPPGAAYACLVFEIEVPTRIGDSTPHAENIAWEWKPAADVIAGAQAYNPQSLAVIRYLVKPPITGYFRLSTSEFSLGLINGATTKVNVAAAFGNYLVIDLEGSSPVFGRVKNDLDAKTFDVPTNLPERPSGYVGLGHHLAEDSCTEAVGDVFVRAAEECDVEAGISGRSEPND